MTQSYDPSSFDKWQHRISLLKVGMTHAEVYRVLHPVVAEDKTAIHSMAGGISSDDIQLDDAYFAAAAFSMIKPFRLVWVSVHPEARKYKIENE